MLDGEISNTATVWGIPVPVASDGRRRWPDAVRAMAVERIAAGARIMDIAAETGAHKSLVAKWVREARADGTADAPAFVELLRPAPDKAPARNGGGHNALSAPVTPPASPAATAECRIRLGDADIIILPDYSGASGRG